MIDADDTFGLSELPRLLRTMTGRPVRYQSLYRKVVDGDLPAMQSETGRWMIRRADLIDFAEKFLKKKAAPGSLRIGKKKVLK